MPIPRNKTRNQKIRRIAITTGGGDAPGLNAVIRGVVMTSHNHGWECVGIREGYNGLLEPQPRRSRSTTATDARTRKAPSAGPGPGLILLTPERVRGITNLGGTILGATNAGNPFRYPVRLRDGSTVEKDRSDELIRAFQREGIDALVVLGGDGSMRVANSLSKKGLKVVGVPKTIDNDLEHTVITFGFDSAVSFATESIDRLHTTAASHRRVMVVEVMGRYAGWIALNCGVSGDAHAILIPEIPFELAKVAATIRERDRVGAMYSIVVVAEGATPRGGKLSVIEKRVGTAERLGGIGERVAAELGTLIDKQTRHVVLGHLLRGGAPTTFDRLLSLRFGAAAVRALAEQQFGVMVALDPPTVRYVPLAEVTSRMKRVPLNCDTIRTARELGISFGD